MVIQPLLVFGCVCFCSVITVTAVRHVCYLDTEFVGFRMGGGFGLLFWRIFIVRVFKGDAVGGLLGL